MATGPAFRQAVGLCRDAPELDVGVHLTAVGGKPLLRSDSSLVAAEGRFYAGAGFFLRRYVLGGIRPDDLRAEWAAQIERVLDHGIAASHLDSHQHVHAFPGIARITLGLAKRYGMVHVRVPMERFPRRRPESLYEFRRMAGSAALSACAAAARLRRRLEQAGHPAPGFLGFREGGRLDGNRLRRLLDSLRPGRVYELMCHPGFSPEDPQIAAWRYSHEKELYALTRPGLRSELAARGIRLCRFRDLLRG
jgi:predicted glycoside hydrolase/deacetylase ChbG (UPF0249 family)